MRKHTNGACFTIVQFTIEKTDSMEGYTGHA